MSDMMNGAPAGESRDAFLDTLRGFAILGVILVHFGGSFATADNFKTPSFNLGLALSQIATFAVPLFTFISGLLASPERSRRQGGIWRYYRSRLLAVGWPYLLASAACILLIGLPQDFTLLASDWAKISWFLGRLFYYGIHPTYYFIPMILLLYCARPLLVWLGPALQSRLYPSAPGDKGVLAAQLALLALFGVLHVGLGLACYWNMLDYYTWCRPNPLFWLLFFYFGLIFPKLAARLPRPPGMFPLALLFALMAGLHLLNWQQLLPDPNALQPAAFNKLNYAYVRPVFLTLDALAVLFAAGLLARRPKHSSRMLGFFGRHSLNIYLWHILVLLVFAWRHPAVLATVKQAPELIIGFALFTAFIIAGASATLSFVLAIPFRYRLELKLQDTGR